MNKEYLFCVDIPYEGYCLYHFKTRDELKEYLKRSSYLSCDIEIYAYVETIDPYELRGED